MVNRYVEREASESGSGLRQLYIPCFEDGCFSVEESGVFDLQEQINANASSCDINVLVARYNAGDITALSRRQGLFGDFTSAPDSYRQALEIVNGFAAKPEFSLVCVPSFAMRSMAIRQAMKS